MSDLPAILANRFYVSLGGGVSRITFSEQLLPDGPEQQRAAVAMAIPDLIELARMIYDLTKEHDQKQKSKN